jgi:hypothetical protein
VSLRRIPLRRGWRLALAIALLASGCIFNQPAPPPTPLPGLNSETRAKMDSVVVELLDTYEKGGPQAAQQYLAEHLILDPDNNLRLTIVINSDKTKPTEDRLKALGVQVLKIRDREIDIRVPADQLAKLQGADKKSILDEVAKFPEVVDVRLPAPKETHDLLGSLPLTPAQVTEGVEKSNAKAWQAAGFTGKGVKVGIIDLGFKGYKAQLGRGLPQNVTAKSFTSPPNIEGTEEHGAAVAEIVHAMAPDAQIFIANVDQDLAGAVNWMAAQGVTVINYSVGSVVGPMDGTGEDQDLINDAFQNANIFWVNSAGNSGTSHYGGVFKNKGGFHDFGKGSTSNRLAVISPAPILQLTLEWADWEKRTVDYDLFLYDKNGKVVASSQNVQKGQKLPVERVAFKVQPRVEYQVAIKAKDPNQAVRLDLYAYPFVSVLAETGSNGKKNLATAEGSLTAPSDAAGAFSVGAFNWKDGKLDAYSSQGPVRDAKKTVKPDIAAHSEVTSSFFGGSFDGTSAAAPHVTGAAALVRGAFPDFTTAQVAKYLTDNVFKVDEKGPDNQYGAGRLNLGPPPGGGQKAPPPAQTPPPPPPKVSEPGQPGGSSGKAVTRSYRHPSGQFSLDQPRDWTKADEANTSVEFDSSGDDAAFTVEFQTGFTGDLSAVLNEGSARAPRGSKNYKVGKKDANRTFKGSPAATYIATFTTSDGDDLQVQRFYVKKGNALYTLTFLALADVWDDYLEAFNNVFNSIEIR